LGRANGTAEQISVYLLGNASCWPKRGLWGLRNGMKKEKTGGKKGWKKRTPYRLRLRKKREGIKTANKKKLRLIAQGGPSRHEGRGRACP